MDNFNTSLPNDFVMEKLKTEKAKTEGTFTRPKTKLLMSMEGGLSTKVKVMESLDDFAIAFENVQWTREVNVVSLSWNPA